MIEAFRDLFENYVKNSKFHLEGLTKSFHCIKNNII